jgi:hypothetical protein
MGAHSTTCRCVPTRAVGRRTQIVTALTETRELIVDALMNAQALNARQDRLLHDPSPEIDSLREILIALAVPELSRAARLRLVARGVHLVDQVAQHNQLERDHEHEVTGHAERLGRKPMTVKDAAKQLRAPLADLVHPMIGGERRARAIALVVDVLERAPEGLLFDPTTGRPRAGIAGELNSVKRTTALADVIQGWRNRVVT